MSSGWRSILLTWTTPKKRLLHSGGVFGRVAQALQPDDVVGAATPRHRRVRLESLTYLNSRSAYREKSFARGSTNRARTG
jgi:hypothetical protein